MRLFKRTVELPEEGCLKLTTGVVCAVIALQDLVDMFEQKGLETVKWTKIQDVLRYMRRIVVIRLDALWTIELKRSIETLLATQTRWNDNIRVRAQNSTHG